MKKLFPASWFRMLVLASLSAMVGLRAADASAPAAAPGASAPPQDPAKELLELFKKEQSITNTLGVVMVWMPGGYRVAQFETTQATYAQIMKENPSKFPGANRPVERVSWTDAVEFCRRLTEKEHKEGKLPKSYRYALPTESEFDAYVADTPLSTAIVSLIGDRPSTEAVGLKPANALGLYDVRGNVWEWCSTPVARGASYQSHEDYLDIKFRFAGSAELKLEDIGFRYVLRATEN